MCLLNPEIDRLRRRRLSLRRTQVDSTKKALGEPPCSAEYHSLAVPFSPHKPAITPRDIAILRDLWLLRYLTTKQISRLHFGHLKLAQRRLRVLTARRFVQRFRPAEAAQSGFGIWWYRLAREGAELVADAEDLTAKKVLPPTRHPSTMGFLAHHALLTDFRIWLREACQASAGDFGYRFIPAYEEVRGERSRRIALSLGGHSRALVPDGVFALKRSDGKQALFVIEVDRGTEPLTGRHRSSITGKFRRYCEAFDSRAEQKYGELLGSNFNGFRILCVVPSERRQAAFLRLAQKTDLEPLVWVTKHSVLESPGRLDTKCWVTSPEEELHSLAE